METLNLNPKEKKNMSQQHSAVVEVVLGFQNYLRRSLSSASVRLSCSSRRLLLVHLAAMHSAPSSVVLASAPSAYVKCRRQSLITDGFFVHTSSVSVVASISEVHIPAREQSTDTSIATSGRR